MGTVVTLIGIPAVAVSEFVNAPIWNGVIAVSSNVITSAFSSTVSSKVYSYSMRLEEKTNSGVYRNVSGYTYITNDQTHNNVGNTYYKRFTPDKWGQPGFASEIRYEMTGMYMPQFLGWY